MSKAEISYQQARKGRHIKQLFTARHSSTGLRLVGLLLLSVLLMVADHRQEYIQPVRNALAWVIWPIQYVVDKPFQLTLDAIDRLRSRQNILRENEQFRAKQSILEFQLQRLAALESENLRLRTLLGSAPETGDEAKVAEIIHVHTRPFSQEVILNKGSNAGVYDGQPVVDANGIIGQVVEVTPNTSVVLLISDITHALPVQNNRDNTRAIAVGTGSAHELELNYVPNSANFAVGDLLVTSGLGDRFPSGYPVGVITEIDTNPGAAFMRIKVKPSAQLDKVREVLLISPKETQPELELELELESEME